jgi:small-conductance mechanosensitive channel
MLSTTLFHIGPFKICFWNLVFLTLIFLIAAILRRIVHRLLKRYVKTTHINLEGRQLAWLKLLSQSVYLLAIYVAVLSFKFNNYRVNFNMFLTYKFIDLGSIKIDFKDLLIIVSVFFGARMLVNLSKLYIGRKFKRNTNYDAASEYVYIQIAKYVIYVFSILFCFQLLNIDLVIILTSSVGLLVGIGLGLQDVFKDMIGGVVLLVEGNLRVGDIVEIHGTSKSSQKSSDAIVAKILRISVRTTQIQTREGNVLIIPNTRLTQEQIENWSHGSELTRFKINVTVDFGADTELIKRLLIQAAMAHPKVKKSHPVFVSLADFGENGLALELIFWADHSWDIDIYKSEIRFEIDRLFREYKIHIPYPHRTINQI